MNIITSKDYSGYRAMYDLCLRLVRLFDVVEVSHGGLDYDYDYDFKWLMRTVIREEVAIEIKSKGQ